MRSVFYGKARAGLHVSLEAGESGQAERSAKGEGLSFVQVRLADHLDLVPHRPDPPLIPRIRSKKKVCCRRPTLPPPPHTVPFLPLF